MPSTSAAEIAAFCVLATVVAAPGVGVWLLARRLRVGPVQAVLFALNRVLARVLWRARTSGPLPVEPGQGAVIVSNHRGPIDPSFFYLTTHRVVHWMVAKEYYRNRLLAWLFRASELIPVSRGRVDTVATKRAIRYAKAGHLVGLFPEGRINTTESVLLPGRPGAAIIAMKARVPVIPCYLTGSPYDGTWWGFLFMSAKVRLEVGSPIDTSPFWACQDQRRAAEALTRLMLREIARLAGQNDFEPELAGRFHKPAPDNE